MVVPSTGIDSLPTELLINILSIFSTRELLSMTIISHRFHDVSLRILHHRLLAAASLTDHKLILECFHPSAKLSTPGLMCDYLGTDGLSSEVEGEGSLYEEVEKTGRLGKLAGLYSHFRPVETERERRPRRPHPAGDIPGSTTFQDPSSVSASRTIEVPSQTIGLESHELFSQLVTITNLVKIGPKRGLYLSCVTIGEGVIRVWRDWLTKWATGSCRTSDAAAAAAETRNKPVYDPEKRMLWVDNKDNVGLRLRVIEREDLGGPMLLRSDEDVSVSYTLEYEELSIRTTQLLLKVEESLLQETNHSGKAIVIGSW